MLPLGEPFYSLHAVSRFRQEARELWDYFVCDNVVYAPEKLQVNPLSQSGYLEQYLSGDMWFEILFGFRAAGYLHTMCAILESFYPPTPSGEGGHGQANGDACEEPMFVGIPKQVQNRQLGILRGVPSVIRLNSLNDPNSVRQNVLRQSLEGLDAGLAGVGEDGERRLLVRLLSRQQGQLPREVIEGRAEVMNNVSEYDRELERWRRLRRELVDIVVDVLGIELTTESIWVAIDESSGFPFEFFKVFTRPLNLEPRTGDVRHAVYSGRDREEAEDPEGTRDTRAQARRRAPRPQEGRKGKALNSRQREEVASRTERGHPGGDHSARRTHLGIPEDA